MRALRLRPKIVCLAQQCRDSCGKADSSLDETGEEEAVGSGMLMLQSPLKGREIATTIKTRIVAERIADRTGTLPRIGRETDRRRGHRTGIETGTEKKTGSGTGTVRETRMVAQEIGMSPTPETGSLTSTMHFVGWCWDSNSV